MSSTGRVSASSVRDRLLEAGKVLFSTRGYDNASTVSLARLAATSESQLMKHFGSKEGLLNAILEESWQRLHEALLHVYEQVSSPSTKFGSMVDVLLNTLESDRRLTLLLLLEGRRIGRDRQTVIQIQAFLNVVSLMDNLLNEMRVSGEFCPSANPQAVRSALIGALEGMLRDQFLSEATAYPAHYTRSQMRETFDIMVRAFGVAVTSKA
jgi:AcrR family transcriptional regulator